VIIPKDDFIDFKEALVFAYLGYKYLLNESNNVTSVTGAQRSLSLGVLHKPGY
jgi:anhydro-N-acetylmuramic acid kinase